MTTCTLMGPIYHILAYSNLYRCYHNVGQVWPYQELRKNVARCFRDFVSIVKASCPFWAYTSPDPVHPILFTPTFLPLCSALKSREMSLRHFYVFWLAIEAKFHLLLHRLRHRKSVIDGQHWNWPRLEQFMSQEMGEWFMRDAYVSLLTTCHTSQENPPKKIVIKGGSWLQGRIFEIKPIMCVLSQNRDGRCSVLLL